MFLTDLEECSGFYREVVEVSTFEIFAFIIIFIGLTAVLTQLFRELFLTKKSSRIMLLFTLSVLSVFIIKIFLPLTERFVEIPFYTKYDCTFNQLVYPDYFSHNTDLVFVYARLLSLISIPLLGLMLAFKFALKAFQLVHRRINTYKN